MSDFDLSFLDPRDVIERLATYGPELAHIGGARDLGNATSETIRAPSAWVILMGERAGEVRYEYSELIEQLVVARFGVVLAVRDLNDRTGDEARRTLLPIRRSLAAILCNWTPPGANHACRFAQGALTSGIGRDGMMFWQDEFTVAFDRRIQMEDSP